ncbi:MAG: NUDIX domain-containing protein [Planctomycetota bacterium]|nr:NUDIX domain-containing protein [Planctomycetota bacterium]MCX8040661.1 NUDIX domain-containing protein [Planctomycetota bacterium]MDW8372804.1 NUDIX domain-containing protein [Planctomycetota bacterium]
MSWLDAVLRCPRCTAMRDGAGNPFRCPACGLVLFANPAVGVGAFVHDGAGRWLFTVRAKDPGKGLLGLPGGFVDADETAEAALQREAQEEIGCALTEVQFVCTAPNRYPYAGVVYDVLDVFFTARLAGAPRADRDEVSAMRWLAGEAVREDEIAFPSMRAAWRILRARG